MVYQWVYMLKICISKLKCLYLLLNIKKIKMQKTWNPNIRSKQEMTTDLMFEEIKQLRKECAGLATELYEVITAIEEADELGNIEITDQIREKVRNAKEFRKSL